MKDLDSEEKLMATYMRELLDQNAAIRWFRSKNIPFYTKPHPQAGTLFTFAYVGLTEEVVQITNHTTDTPELRFTNDRSRFINLKPGETERWARTEFDYTKPIEINLYKINAATLNGEQKFDIGDAVSILFHEYGHKLGPLEIEKAIDSLAHQLGEYVRGKVNTQQLKNGVTLYTLFFRMFDPRIWLNQGFTGIMVDFDHGIPIQDSGQKLNMLPIYDNQGFYAWSEQNEHYADWTKPLLKTMHKKDLIKRDYAEENFYKFVEHNNYVVTSFKIQEKKAGELQITAEIAHVEIVIPFMIPNVSPPPDKTKFNQRYYNSQLPYIIDPRSLEIKALYNSNLLQVTTAKEIPGTTYYIPDVKARIIEAKNYEKELIVKIELKGTLNQKTALGSQPIDMNQAEITLNSKGKKISVVSSEFDPAAQVFTFQIPEWQKVIEAASITNIYVKPTIRSLVDAAVGVKAEVMLPEAIPLTTAPVQTQLSSPEVHLKSIRTDRTIRMTFNSSEPLRQLNLQINITQSIFAGLTVSNTEELIHRRNTENITSSKAVELNLTPQQFKQSKGSNGNLTVEVDLSSLYSMLETRVVQSEKTQAQILIETKMVQIAHPSVLVQGVGFTTESMQQKKFDLRKEQTLDITPNSADYKLYNLLRANPVKTNFEYKFCQSLF